MVSFTIPVSPLLVAWRPRKRLQPTAAPERPPQLAGADFARGPWVLSLLWGATHHDLCLGLDRQAADSCRCALAYAGGALAAAQAAGAPPPAGAGGAAPCAGVGASLVGEAERCSRSARHPGQGHGHPALRPRRGALVAWTRSGRPHGRSVLRWGASHGGRDKAWRVVARRPVCGAVVVGRGRKAGEGVAGPAFRAARMHRSLRCPPAAGDGRWRPTPGVQQGLCPWGRAGLWAHRPQRPLRSGEWPPEGVLAGHLNVDC